jgi:hypothetical protein
MVQISEEKEKMTVTREQTVISLHLYGCKPRQRKPRFQSERIAFIPTAEVETMLPDLRQKATEALSKYTKVSRPELCFNYGEIDSKFETVIFPAYRREVLVWT